MLFKKRQKAIEIPENSPDESLPDGSSSLHGKPSGMTREDIRKALISKTIIPLASTIILLIIFLSSIEIETQMDYLRVLIYCGIPFGSFYTIKWLLSGGRALCATFATTALTLLIGEILGSAILLGTVVCALWNIPATVILMKKVNTAADRQEGDAAGDWEEDGGCAKVRDE